MEPSNTNAAAAVAPQPLALPTLVFGVVEVHRLQRELEALEDFFEQAALRNPGKPIAAAPRTSRLLEALASENQRSLLKHEDREALLDFLRMVGADAPKIHVSFAVDPSAAFLAKLITWFRVHIHPLVLVQIGLQPTIAAGCVVRTPNHVFDLTLRQHFYEKRDLLLQSIRGEAAQ